MSEDLLGKAATVLVVLAFVLGLGVAIWRLFLVSGLGAW